MFISKDKLEEIEFRLGKIERWIGMLESVLIQARPGDDIEIVFSADKELNAEVRGTKLN